MSVCVAFKQLKGEAAKSRSSRARKPDFFSFPRAHSKPGKEIVLVFLLSSHLCDRKYSRAQNIITTSFRPFPFLVYRIHLNEESLEEMREFELVESLKHRGLNATGTKAPFETIDIRSQC
jgi:hypothetical protein